MTDDAAVSGPRLELARQRGDLRLQLRGRLARGGVAAGRLRQPLMRERQREQIRHAASEVDVRLAEAFDVACKKKERAEHPGAERHRHAHAERHPEPREDPPRSAARRDLGRPSRTTYGCDGGAAVLLSVRFVGARKPGSSTCAPVIAYTDRLAVLGP